MPATYTCSHCGRQHEGLPTDWGFKLPDEVYALSHLDKYARTRHNRDLCTLDERRYFLRTLLPIRLLEGSADQHFNWGVWVEVDRATHDLYVHGWDQDLSSWPRAKGRIANHIKVHEGSLGLPVQIEFRAASERPAVWLAPELDHPLALEQRRGITGKRQHDILAALGHFGDEGDA